MANHPRTLGSSRDPLVTARRQIIREVLETLAVLHLTRADLARRMGKEDSRVSWTLADRGRDRKGMRLSTVVQMAEALDCDIEVNFIRRPAPAVNL